MKIGIVTFHMACNYGAVLQAYALTQYLRSIGHEACIIDYRPHYLPLMPSSIKGRKKLKLSYPLNWWMLKQFRDFREHYLPMTSQSYDTSRDLKEDHHRMDAYICGSDQIWNPSLTDGGWDTSFFLQFAEQTSKRIAYAASFGTDVVPVGQEEALGRLLMNLDEISVREDSSLEIVKKTTGRNASLVVDPTLLLQDYEQLVYPKKYARKYILFFRLQKDPYIYDVLRRVSSRLSIPIVTVTHNKKIWQEPGRVLLNPSPNLWLSLIKNSTAVVTNSYHCTIFSILFRRQFLATHLIGGHQGRNGRMETLLDITGLSDRFVSSEDRSPEEMVASDIDWELVSCSLGLYQEQSKSFLIDALSLPRE